jgi:hypothetical protein
MHCLSPRSRSIQLELVWRQQLEPKDSVTRYPESLRSIRFEPAQRGKRLE